MFVFSNVVKYLLSPHPSLPVYVCFSSISLYTLIADSVFFKTFLNFLKPMLLSIASLLIVV